MCRIPVTFGGGITTVYGSRSSGVLSKYFFQPVMVPLGLGGFEVKIFGHIHDQATIWGVKVTIKSWLSDDYHAL